MLEIEGVSIRFGDNPEAVSDTTFTVGDGDRLAVVRALRGDCLLYTSDAADE